MYHINYTGNIFAVSRVNIYPPSRKMQGNSTRSKQFLFLDTKMLMKTGSQRALQKDEKLSPAIIQSAAKHEAPDIQLPCRNYSNEATASQDNCRGWKSPPSFLDTSNAQ
ncbi:hypothetical protein CEXT_112471 [Caerostris extrusa]|uniref:Uncharacterized protein n=1 Tax=Caerostris extrusa TaxID=172846 RepID=A0AAV4W237_CAEEX|nr:hypothetical protein CEXT_112471 [Caerostris extrusa]